MGFFKDFGAELCGMKCQNGVYEADLTNVLASGAKTYCDVLIARLLFKRKNLVEMSKDVSASVGQVKQGVKEVADSFKAPQKKVTDDRSTESSEILVTSVDSEENGGTENV